MFVCLFVCLLLKDNDDAAKLQAEKHSGLQKILYAELSKHQEEITMIHTALTSVKATSHNELEELSSQLTGLINTRAKEWESVHDTSTHIVSQQGKTLVDMKESIADLNSLLLGSVTEVRKELSLVEKVFTERCDVFEDVLEVNSSKFMPCVI